MRYFVLFMQISLRRSDFRLSTEFTSPIAKSTSPGLSDTTFFSLCPLLLLVTPCYPLLPVVTSCYLLLPLVTLVTLVTPCYPLLPRVTPYYICYHVLPLVTLVTLC